LISFVDIVRTFFLWVILMAAKDFIIRSIYLII
jgi:hypothetical protein